MTDFNQDVATDELYPPPAEFSADAHVKTLDDYRTTHAASTDPEQQEAFWAKMGHENLTWMKPFDKAVGDWNFHRSKGAISTEWFVGGELNACYNCLDKFVEEGKGDKVAFLYEANDVDDPAHRAFTYKEVLSMVCKLANTLKGFGVQKGDVVAIYLPMIVELPVAMLACARIGAIHSVVFGGFGADALAQRIDDGKSRVVITADGVMRGAKPIQLKKIVDQAASMCKESKVTHVLCVKRLGVEAVGHDWVEGRDHWYFETTKDMDSTCPCEPMKSEDPLFILYTSGSTGKPKGVIHHTAGYLMSTQMTFKYSFDIHPERDVWWCTADCGWITGHSYITYGPMLNGVTQVLFEGVPTHPDFSRFWSCCDKYQVTQFYTAPTAIRALMRQGDEPVTKTSRKSLKVLGTVGEPINPQAWKWYYNVVGDKRCPVVDTYWQTETGAHMLAPLPGATPAKPGSATFPCFGVKPQIVDEKGQILEGVAQGYLVMQQPWPSMMRTVYGDHQRFEETYFSQFDGFYCTGDGAKRDADGYYWLTGRIDDVINVSGHRIGTAEVESALVAHDLVSEAAVVGCPHEIKGEGIYCYVTLNAGIDGTDDLVKVLKQQVRTVIGAFAQPDVIHWAPNLPKTRSGKIMRRILRKIALPSYETEDFGDTSTLLDPGVVDALKANRPK